MVQKYTIIHAQRIIRYRKNSFFSVVQGFCLKKSLFFLTSIDEDPVVVISTFVPDKTHPAGLLALKIVRLSVIKISQKCHEIVIML